MKRLCLYAGFIVAFVVVGNRILRLIPGRLGQDFVVGFLTERAGPLRELSAIRTAKLFSFVWELGLPLCVAIVMTIVADRIMKARLRNGS